MSGHCEFLYVNYPACDETYADQLGWDFSSYQIGYAAVSLLLFSAALYQFVVIIRKKGWKPLDTQKKLFFHMQIVTLSLIVRSIDPFGWRTWINQIILGFCYEWSSSAIYSLVWFIVADWITIMCKVSGRRRHINVVSKIFMGLHITIWVSFTVLSMLQATQNDIWFYRCIKFAIGIIAILTLICLQSYYGVVIFMILHQNEKLLVKSQVVKSDPYSRVDVAAEGASDPSQLGSTGTFAQLPAPSQNVSTETPNGDVNRVNVTIDGGSPNPSTDTISRQNSEEVCVADRATSESVVPRVPLEVETRAPAAQPTHKRAQTRSSIKAIFSGRGSSSTPNQKKLSQVDRILKYVLIATFFQILTCLWQLYIIYNAYNQQYTVKDPADPPKTLTDVAFEGAADYVAMISVCLGLIFFRRRHDTPSQDHNPRVSGVETTAKSRPHHRVRPSAVGRTLPTASGTRAVPALSISTLSQPHAGRPPSDGEPHSASLSYTSASATPRVPDSPAPADMDREQKEQAGTTLPPVREASNERTSSFHSSSQAHAERIAGMYAGLDKPPLLHSASATSVNSEPDLNRQNSMGDAPALFRNISAEPQPHFTVERRSSLERVTEHSVTEDEVPRAASGSCSLGSLASNESALTTDTNASGAPMLERAASNDSLHAIQEI